MVDARPRRRRASSRTCLRRSSISSLSSNTGGGGGGGGGGGISGPLNMLLKTFNNTLTIGAPLVGKRRFISAGAHMSPAETHQEIGDPGMRGARRKHTGAEQLGEAVKIANERARPPAAHRGRGRHVQLHHLVARPGVEGVAARALLGVEKSKRGDVAERPAGRMKAVPLEPDRDPRAVVDVACAHGGASGKHDAVPQRTGAARGLLASSGERRNRSAAEVRGAPASRYPPSGHRPPPRRDRASARGA